MSLGVVYETEDGFGSIGWLGELKSDTVHVVDPVLGEVEVLYDELVHLFDTESGSVSGFHAVGFATEESLARAANPTLRVKPVKRPKRIPYAYVERGMVIRAAEPVYDDPRYYTGDEALALDAGAYVVLEPDSDGETELVEIDLDTGATGDWWQPNSAPLSVDFTVEGRPRRQYELVGRVSEGDMQRLAWRWWPERAGNPLEAISGYPIAWERVRQWREGAALDWRTVALVGVFCLTTVQRPIEVAERSYRAFGPTILRNIESGSMPEQADLERLLRSAEVGGLEKTLSRNIVAMLEYAPWLADKLQASRDYTRGFRNRVALDRVPTGLSLAKLSFMVSILGRDAACFDARLYSAFFRGDRAEITRVQKSVEKSSGTVTKLKLQRYMKLEDKLRRTPFWDKEWPMPYAQAQWRMWESLGDEPALHGALWDVVPEPESRELRVIKNRLLRE